MWADGVHPKIRLSETHSCLLVLMGVRVDDGTKELIAIAEGLRESTESWADLLRDCRRRGMRAPMLVVGDGAMGLWRASAEVRSTTSPPNTGSIFGPPNPIESTFSTVKLRTKVTRGAGRPTAALAMVFKRVESAQARSRATPHLTSSRSSEPAPTSRTVTMSNAPRTSQHDPPQPTCKS